MDQMTLDGATKFHNGSRDSDHTKFGVMSHAWPNPFFKCEVYTFIHSKDMTGPKILKHDPCQLPSPLSGMVCHQWAMITYMYVRNLKSLSPPVMMIWKAMKKVENGGGLGLLEVTQGHWKMSSDNSAYKLLVALHCNYFSILHSFWVIARYYWSKIDNFNLPHLYLVPRWEWPTGVLSRSLIPENKTAWTVTRLPGLLCGIVMMRQWAWWDSEVFW